MAAYFLRLVSFNAFKKFAAFLFQRKHPSLLFIHTSTLATKTYFAALHDQYLLLYFYGKKLKIVILPIFLGFDLDNGNEGRPMDLNVQDSRSLAARNRLGWTLGDQTPAEASSLQSGPSRWKSQHRRCCSSAYTHSAWSGSVYPDTGNWDRNC